VLVLAAAVAAAAWFWLRAPRALPVRTAAVVEARPGSDGAGPAVLNASGYVTARRRATVSSKMTGKVVEVLVEEGMGSRPARCSRASTDDADTVSRARGRELARRAAPPPRPRCG